MRMLAALLSPFALLAVPSSASTGRSPDIDARLDVGGRAIHLKCRGSGLPVVVVDAGLGTGAATDPGWQRIADRIAPVTRICLSDRAGLGSSDPAPKGPRTSADAAVDLERALKAARLPGPYLLVGHSIGGLHAQVFAARFPSETAGLVLVSSTHPDQRETWLSLLPAVTPGEEAPLAEARSFLIGMQDPARNEERLDIGISSGQARRLRTLGAKPVIVATHSPRFRMAPGLSEPLAIKLEDATQAMQRQFLSLSSEAHQNIAESAGHGLPHEAPAFVVDNILQGVAVVRRQAGLPDAKRR